MANYCRGDLRITGTKEDIRNFMLDGLGVNKLSEVEIIENEDSIELIKEGGWYYIDCLKRASIQQERIKFNYADGFLEVFFRQAWCIEVEQLAEVSRKYNVDFSIVGYENDMGFIQDIVIEKGEVVKHEVTKDDADISQVEVRLLESPFKYRPFSVQGQCFNYYDFEEDELIEL